MSGLWEFTSVYGASLALADPVLSETCLISRYYTGLGNGNHYLCLKLPLFSLLVPHMCSHENTKIKGTSVYIFAIAVAQLTILPIGYCFIE